MLKNTYLKEKLVYKGPISNVFKYYNTNTNEIQAIKIFDESHKKDFETEINTLKLFSENRKNINYFLEYFNINDRYYIVYPYYEITLHQFIIQNKLNINAIKYILYELIQPLKYIHNILESYHGDIKLDNVLVSSDLSKVKLIDFGSVSKNNTYHSKSFGTILFMAPEVLLLTDNITSKCDIWSFACLIYELITNDILFDYKEERNILPEISQLNCIIDICGNINDVLLLSAKKDDILVNKNYLHKGTFNLNTNEIIYNRIKKYNDNINITNIISSCIKINPSERSTIDELEQQILML